MIEIKPGKKQMQQKMRAYFGDDLRRIEHANKVTAYAEQLFEIEGGNYQVIMAAAIFHDIGIHEAERKYGSSAGGYQELEGPPIARNILGKLGLDALLMDEVCNIIAHHHRPGIVNTLNFKVLYDADMLVNLAEGVNIKHKEKLSRIIERAFLTAAGKELAGKVYLEKQEFPQKEEKMDQVSQHENINRMYEQVKQAGLSSVADRYAAQDKIRCRTYCEKGLSCQLCSNGPCRLIPGKVEQGVCGIDAKGMVIRNVLHKNNMGIAAYTFHCKDAAKTLKATAQGKTPFKLKDTAKLDSLAQALGVSGAGDVNAKAVAVADAVLASLSQDSDQESIMVTAFAPESRLKVWRELGILPGGPLNEIIEATTRSMTNVDGDWVSLAKTCLRLGIASAYGALVPLEMMQDILFGTPTPHEAEVDLGILDPAYVNILPNGHEPFVGAALIDVARRPEVQQQAKAAGASGIHIVGSIETGQELMQRYACDDVFVGLTGNWLNQEYVLATGTVDLFAMDMNCSVPNLKEYADKYGATLVSVSHLVAIPGVDKHIDYVPEKVEEQATALIELAIDNFKNRQGKATVSGLKKTKILTGFSTESVLSALGGSLDPLLDLIKQGTILGVTALVSCSSLKNGGQDVVTIQVAKELIKRNILVLSAGCGNGACQVGGLCSISAQEWAGDGLKAVCKQLGIPPVLSFGTCSDTGRLILLVTAVADALGVDPSQLPVAVTAPEYMEQKATIDAFGAVAFGLYTHVSPVPPVTGSPEVVQLLTQDVEQLVGGKLAVGDDPVQIVDGIEAHIRQKREALGI